MSNKIPTIVTYHSTNNKPEWFAYLKPNGEFLGVRMEGATEAEAIERAKNWWINEKRHQDRITGAMELEDNEVGSKGYKVPGDQEWGSPTTPTAWGTGLNNNSWSSAPIKDASEHGMAGKVWLIDHVNKKRLRADPGQVEALLASGWEKGGPKTGFRS